jgi:very-short-patch-repair endonuclease
MSELEERFVQQMNLAGVPVPAREFYFFLPLRRWHFDFAWADILLAVEIEGGTWAGGRHTRGQGFRDDCVKYNTAALRGWRVLRFTTDMITSGAALKTLLEAFLLVEMENNNAVHAETDYNPTGNPPTSTD